MLRSGTEIPPDPAMQQRLRWTRDQHGRNHVKDLVTFFGVSENRVQWRYLHGDAGDWKSWSPSMNMYHRIAEMSRTSKTVLILGFDSLAILAAIVLAIILRVGTLWPAEALERALPFIGTMLGFGIVAALMMGLPRIKLSAFDIQTTFKIAMFATIMGASGMRANFVTFVEEEV